MKEIIEAFDGVKEIVYIADMENYNILFMNKAGLEVFGYDNMEQVVGKKCYEVFQGKKSPCVFCTNDRLHKEQYVEWQHQNLEMGRRYVMKDRLMEWDGKLLRLGIIDEAEGDSQQKLMKERRERLAREQIVMECIKMMYSSMETDVAIDNTLEILGTHLGSERTYVFQVYGKHMDNTYEWCAPGVSQEMDALQQVPLSIIDRWIPYFNQNECIIIQDLEEIKETAPEEYNILKPQKVQSLIAVPLMEKERLVGYFGVDNPHAGNLGEISNIMKMLAYFFQSLLERKKKEDYLKKIGYTDGLTGALNRNAFIRDTMSNDGRELVSAGVFFIDINGLKKANDTYGHEAGDALIRQAYHITCSVVKKYPVYRLGGDEFVVLCRNISGREMRQLEGMLRKELSGKNGCSAAIGASFRENPGDLSIMVEQADRSMYEDKKKHYESA